MPHGSILLNQAFAPARANFDIQQRLQEIYNEEKPEYADGAHGTVAPSSPVAPEIIAAHQENIRKFNFQFAKLIAEIHDCHIKLEFTFRQRLKLIIFCERIQKRNYYEFQANEFYQAIKHYIENIACAIANPDPAAIKQNKTIMHDLLKHLDFCGTGVFSHVRNASNLLTNQHCLETMLARLREIIVRQYADNHAHSNNMISSDYVHVYNVCLGYACQQGWNPLGADRINAVNEYHANLAKLSADHYKQFNKYFLEQYNPFSIIQYITDSLFGYFYERIRKGKHDLGTICFERLEDFTEFFVGLPLIGKEGILDVLFKLTESPATASFAYAGIYYQLRPLSELKYTLTRFYLQAQDERLFKGIAHTIDSNLAFTLVAGHSELCFRYNAEKDEVKSSTLYQLSPVSSYAGISAFRDNQIPLTQATFEAFVEAGITDFSGCIFEEITLINTPGTEKFDFSGAIFQNVLVSAKQFIFHKLHQCNQKKSTLLITDHSEVVVPDIKDISEEGKANLTAALFFALEMFNDTKLVGLLVQSGAKLHVRNSHHLLPVELARKKSHWAYIEVMAENVNAIDNVKDRYKFGLCLFDAVANNLPAKALKLLNANADPNAVSISCLHWAAKNNYIELLEPLAKAKVKPQATNSSHHTAVEEAALNQHWDFVIKHAELFPDTEQQYNYHKVLMMAFKNVKVAVAKALILAKSKLDLLDEFSNTALHYAVEIQSAELVAILAKDKKLLTIRNYPERKTAFQKACDALAWHCIKAFAENITNANTLDDNYRLELGLGLLLAAKYNETAVAIALINAQTPVILTSTDDMNSCVHWACIYDNTHLLEILLRAHASLHFVNENGLNPLQLSESLGHDECVNMLTNYDNFQRFYTAMLMQEFDLAKLILIEHKEIFCMYALVTEDGETALHLVAFHNLPELVTLLIAAGADLAALDKKRRTPILAAAENKSYAAIEAFVDAVADEEGTYGYGSAMLTVYHEEEYILADKLLARKADVKFHDPGLITCLVLSCQRARKDDIVKFLTFGADPETGPDRESRPIAILAANRHWDCLHAFLSFIKVEDNLDDRLLLGFALPYTLYNGQLGLSLKLIELNADVNYEYDGENCLHLAIKGGMFSLIKPLLRAGADPHAVNSENMTPIAMANAQDKNVRRRNRFNFFARPVYFNISMSIAAVEAEQAVPSVAPSLSLRAG